MVREIPQLAVAAVTASIAPIASATAATAVAAAPATPAASATTTASTATVAAPTATAASTFTLWTRFVHHQGPAEEFLSIQCRDGLFGFSVIFYFREAKPARLAGKAIAKQGERIGLHARFRKQRLHFLFSSLER